MKQPFKDKALFEELWPTTADTPARRFVAARVEAGGDMTAACFEVMCNRDIPLEHDDRRHIVTVFTTQIFFLALPFKEGKREAQRLRNVIMGVRREQARALLKEEYNIKGLELEDDLRELEGGISLEALRKRRQRANRRK
jgi:hypothetical protein